MGDLHHWIDRYQPCRIVRNQKIWQHENQTNHETPRKQTKGAGGHGQSAEWWTVREGLKGPAGRNIACCGSLRRWYGGKKNGRRVGGGGGAHCEGHRPRTRQSWRDAGDLAGRRSCCGGRWLGAALDAGGAGGVGKSPHAGPDAGAGRKRGRMCGFKRSKA